MSSIWNGRYYAGHSEMQFRVAVNALSFLDFPPHAKILDIGCGDGKITKYIADLAGGPVVGVDRSPSMLETAKTLAGGRLSFQQADATALPFESQFDRIVSFNCLHWVPEITTALEQIHKALVPGGIACLVIAPTQSRYKIHDVLDQVVSQEKWRPYFGEKSKGFIRHSFAEWASSVEEAGLVPLQMQLIDGSMEYPDKAAFAAWIGGWVPFGTVPENKREEFLYDIVETYTALIPCESDGTVHFLLDELMIKCTTTKT